jgi:glycosyltransferase involved in cell wall biosynthesis
MTPVSDPQDISISIVAPVYGCASCIEELRERVAKAVAPLAKRYEIILVDDRSLDDAWNIIVALQALHPEVRGIRLSRNFGQQIAISAGLAEARGDSVVVMDCDLQDPPERIPELFSKLQEGYDLILARRTDRNHSPFRVLAARIYFGLMSRLTEETIDGSYGNFSILSRKVVNAFLLFSERERHYLFVLRWLGFKMGSIEYEHQKRPRGKSSYSLKRLVRLAIDGLFFQATVLLRWIVTLGLGFASFGVGLAMYFIYQRISHGSVEGWTSLVVLILICTGAILVSVGVIGLYVGKIFDQAKGRPLYIVDSIASRRNP